MSQLKQALSFVNVTAVSLNKVQNHKENNPKNIFDSLQKFKANKEFRLKRKG